MNELSLFSGAGGGILASQLLGWRVVCAVELDPYCREVLLRRQEEGILEPFPIWGDVRTFNGRGWSDRVDVVTAGFPCQPFSVAGKREGEADERNLWPDTIRVIREVRPRFCLLENVPGLLAHEYFGTILGELAESGYDARWDCIPASACGAPHRRDRLWILAYAQRDELRDEPGRGSGASREGQAEPGDDGAERNVAHGNSRGQQERTELYGESEVDTAGRHPQGEHADGCRDDLADAQCPQRRPPNLGKGGEAGQGVLPQREEVSIRAGASGQVANTAGEGYPTTGTADPGKEESGWSQPRLGRPSWWSTEPELGRVAHGVAYRVDRLRALGNGQVPIVAAAAWNLLTEEA